MSSGVMYQCLSTSPQEEKEFKCVERSMKVWVSAGLKRGT